MKKIKSLVKNDRKITLRNYFIIIVVSFLTIALTLYIRSFIINYKTNIASVSIFTSNVQSLHINDLDFTVPEAGEAIVYVSYTNNIKIASMEKTLYSNIESNNMKDKIMYLDVTNYLDNNEYITILKNKFPNIAEEINSAPLFIYVKDGKAVEAMSSELKMVDNKIYNKLIKKYEIE